MRFGKWARSRKKRRDAPGIEGVSGEIEAIQAALVRRGLPDSLSGMLANRALSHLASLNPTCREAYLDGLSMAFELQDSAGTELARNLQGLREVERIMGAFSGELGKLDEVVGVLNTYVHRLKTSREEEDDRLLN